MSSLEFILDYWWVWIISVTLLAILLKKLLDGYALRARTENKGSLFRDLTRATCPACQENLHLKEIRKRGSVFSPKFHCPHCDAALARDRKSSIVSNVGVLGTCLCSLVLALRDSLDPMIHGGVLVLALACVVSVFWSIGSAKLVARESHEG